MRKRFSRTRPTASPLKIGCTHGMLHLPLPAELRHGKIEVTATLRAARGTSPALPRATPEMPRRRKEALAKLRQLNPFREVQDPVAWQKEIRQDRPLPGRD